MGNTNVKVSVEKGNWQIKFQIGSSAPISKGFVVNLFKKCESRTPSWKLIVGEDGNTSAHLVDVENNVFTTFGSWAIPSSAETYTLAMCDNSLTIYTDSNNTNNNDLSIFQPGFNQIECLTGHFVDENEAGSEISYLSPETNPSCLTKFQVLRAESEEPSPWSNAGVIAAVSVLGVLLFIFFVIAMVFTDRVGVLWNVPMRPGSPESKAAESIAQSNQTASPEGL